MKLLELARAIDPDFPSSAGRPFRTPDPELLERRHELARSVRQLDADDAAEVAARAWRLWMGARDVPGGRRFLAEALDGRVPVRTRWRALALYGDGLFAWWQRDGAGSRRRNEEALELARALDDAEALALSQLGLARLAVDDGEHERGRELAAGARACGAAFGEAMAQAPLHLEAQATRLAGDYDRAAALFGQSLALNRRIDDPSMVVVELHNLGHVEIHRGNADAAECCFEQIPPAYDPYAPDMTRLNDAAVAFLRGDAHRAHALLGDIDDGGLATDDRFELEWLRRQLACVAS
jgi:tetratricopeptide (TPR) repeat protein